MTDRRTMIEDYIPVEEISYESAREKVARRRQGHVSTLHLWWARRPLAACRAAVYATFAPPAEGESRTALKGFFEDLCHWTGPVLPERDALRAAREVVSTAADGERPRVLDMFAGGGAIPLEALRLGADAVAVELNPVAHLIQLCTLAYPQRYGRRLRDAVEQWGAWVIDETKKEVGDLYPDVLVDNDLHGSGDLFDRTAGGRKLRPIAYLWTRAIPSPARGFERGLVPLVRQTWLQKKKGNYVAARPVVDRERLTVRYEIVRSNARSEKTAIAEWGFNPAGSSVRGATTCPYSGTSVTAKEAKRAGLAGEMVCLPIAQVAVQPGRRGKLYLAIGGANAPTTDEACMKRVEALCASSGLDVPAEPLPQKLTGGMCSLYGLDAYGKLFTPRQVLLLLTLCNQVRAAYGQLVERFGDETFAQAVAAYLGLLVGRVADRSSTLTRWEPTYAKVVNTYARQALPMVWDFPEANPFGGSAGDARLQLDFILQVIDHAVASGPGRPAEVIRGRAQRLPLEDGSIDAVITDPPYYDNISYADLSDFFYVWHKRALRANVG